MIKKNIIVSAVGFLLAALSQNSIAVSVTGPVTLLNATTSQLFVTVSDGTSGLNCYLNASSTMNNGSVAMHAATTTVLSTAKASGKNVTMHCSSGSITQVKME